MTGKKITVEWVQTAKQRGERIAALTCYDYPTARLLDEAGVPVLLVGDSLGMVVLGFPDTTHVTMPMMEHHVAAVARARPHALVVADLPYHSYFTSEEALGNARRMIAAGAEAVKLEGGLEQEEKIRALIQAGIPVMGHLGMLPQSVVDEGGVYRIKGKTVAEKDYLHQSMRFMAEVGVFAVVLELVLPELAAELTASYSVPTIGIGSGAECDGQILVTHDLIGLFPWFRPKFAQAEAEVGAEIKRAATVFRAQVRATSSTDDKPNT